MYTHHNKEIPQRMERRDITDYIRTGLLHLQQKGYRFNLSHPLEVKRLQELLNDPRNTTFKSAKDVSSGFCYWNEQRVDFIPSNLGKEHGFIFYFLCNSCHRRVKYLYEYNLCYSPLCRTCCRLKYKAPSRKARELSRLIRKPYLSVEAKYMLIKKAGIRKEDIPDDLNNYERT